MGCFNISGFFSHAPIQYKDRIGAILCIVEEGKKGCPIGSTGFGYHPIMAPVYGNYDDYGGIENVDESYTTKLFKDVVGIDFTEFISMNHRNTETTLADKDNNNFYDNIPEYQKYLRKIIPNADETITRLVEDSKNNKNLTEELREQAENIDKMFIKWYEHKELCSCAHIIYEHESVLKSLIDIGKSTADWMEDKVKDIIKQHEEQYNNLPSIKLSDTEINKFSAEDKVKYKKLLEIFEKSRIHSIKFDIEQYVSLGDCNICDADMFLYIKSEEDYGTFIFDKEKIKAVKETYALAHALNMCGGYFCASKEDSQETNAKQKVAVHKEIIKILSKKKKSEEESEVEDY